MSDHDPINELTDVVDLFGAGAGRAVSCPVADDGLPELPWDDSEGVSNNRFVVRVGDLSGAMRQYAREAIEADRRARDAALIAEMAKWARDNGLNVPAAWDVAAPQPPKAAP